MAEAELQFEWDEAKAAANLAKHGVSFLTAAAIFENEILERIDDREDYGELRFIGLGWVDIEVYRVVYTWRAENVIRIIGAQKAGRHEREIYYRTTFP
ncbi:MAG: BrnT family toxin [Hyphomicrobiales bacterium]|nr:BrnT family toxin [Hyphomicrobiales bacterium]MBV8664038.1 BrnT family toxin [Hyphomicrobiales bacterium]